MPLDLRSLRCRMLRRVCGTCLSLITLILVPAAPSATTVRPLTFDELVAEAQAIIRCQVVDVRSEWRRRGEEAYIVTLVTVSVERTLKGRPSPQLLLEFLGGTIGDRTLTIAEMPQFKVDDRNILLLNDTILQASPLVGFFLGRFPIRVDAFTGRQFVTTSDGRPLTDPTDVLIGPARSLSNLRRVSGAALSVTQVEALIQQRVPR
jgi:hypothetical protein